MDVNDLINPLRYVNLGEINPTNIKSIGDGVFPEPSTLDHLAILDLVTKAYQAIHLPSYGHVIPNQTATTTALFGSSKTTADLITVPNNETYRILGIGVRASGNYEFTSAALRINEVNVLDLANIDTLTNTFSGLITDINDDLIVTGGATLSLESSANPNDDVLFDIVYDLHQQ